MSSGSGIEWWEVCKAIDAEWNNDFKGAIEILTPKAATMPRYALHLAEIVFIRSFITADIKDTEDSIQHLKVVKDLTEAQLKFWERGQVPPGVEGVDPKNRRQIVNRYLDARLVLADMLILSAVMKFSRSSKIAAVLALRKSWKTFENTKEKVREYVREPLRNFPPFPNNPHTLAHTNRSSCRRICTTWSSSSACSLGMGSSCLPCRSSQAPS
jgi:hypothetical protein